MGLPAGWVTDPAIGLTRNQQLKALGNGVVPQQAALALRLLLGQPSLPSLPSLPTPTTFDSGDDRCHKGGNPTLVGSVLGPKPRDVERFLLPTPQASDGHPAVETRDPQRRMDAGRQMQVEDVVRLLPTPAVNDMGEGKTPDAWDEWTDRMKGRHGNGNGHGKSLAIEAQRLDLDGAS